MDNIKIVFVLLFSTSGVGTIETSDRKYDIDHKVLKSIVELEHDHEIMKYLLRNYQQLEDTDSETAKILESMEQTMRNVEDKLSEIEKTNKKTAETLTSQGEAIQALADKIDNANTETEQTLQQHGNKLGDLETGLQVQSSKHDNDMEKLQKVSGSGSTFTRWGRSVCPETNSTLAYSGFVGGSHYTHTGAASNYLCLTKDPIWNEKVAATYLTYIYGSEYEFYGQSTFGRDLVNHEPPCAVCRSPRATTIMIPGRNVCYDGWTMEYNGYLVAGHNTHKAATEYICLDITATKASGSSNSDKNGKLMYTVRTSCGSLHCPPYKNEWTFTCVVCSK